MLEKRHQEWMTIWNANCDSAKPKKRSELLQDLETWERTMGSRAPTLSRAANVGAQIKDKDFDGAAWAAKHDTSFKDLIARARSSKSAVAQKTDETKLNEDSKEDMSGQDDGKSMNGAVLQPGSSADVIDLTEPPTSSQLAPTDSPSRGRSPAKESNMGILGDSGGFPGQGIIYPPGSIPAFSPSRGP